MTEHRTDIWQRTEDFLNTYSKRRLGPITLAALVLLRENHINRNEVVTLLKKVDRERRSLKVENAALLKRR